MDMESWVLGEPLLDLRMLVGGVVVADQMQRLVRRRFPVDLAQEVECCLSVYLTGDRSR
jgi:hypothetical protein